MRKWICTALLSCAVFYSFLTIVQPVAAASKTTTVAVVLLGSLEFQSPPYYEITTESLRQKFPGSKFTLLVGDYPLEMFNRFADKQGLIPGENPSEAKMIKFSWLHSFDEVLFVLLSTPNLKSNEFTYQWEKSEATITAHSLRFEARTKKKLSDATTTQTDQTVGRSEAKMAAFRKCLDALVGRL